ncbi:MAG: diguanylate cyclase domain-containing protein [Telluria sp.]
MITPFRFQSRWARLLLSANLLPVFALTLLAAMWFAMSYHIDVEREAAASKALAESQSQARTLSDHVGQVLRQAGHATTLFKLRHEETGGAFPLAEFARAKGLLDSVLPVRLAIPIAQYDAAGRRTDALNAASLPEHIGREPWFHALAAGDAELVSGARDGRASSDWHIRVARGLADERGRFAGAIVMAIDPNLFIDDYDRLDIDLRSALVLVSRDTGLSAGRAADRLFTSDTLAFSPLAPGARQTFEVAPSTRLDAIDRIYAARDMAQYRLLAVVGIPRDVAMASFERQRIVYIAILLVASGMIVAVSAVLMRQRRRLSASVLAARDAQAMLRGAVHGSLDAFVLLKTVRGAGGAVEDFVIADINNRGADFMELPRQQLIGQKAFALVPRLRATGLLVHCIEVADSGQPWSGENEVHMSSGATLWAWHQVVPIAGGIALTTRDITERKRDEIEIRSSSNFLQSLINNLPVLICVKSARPDNFGQVMIWNQAAASMTGYRAEQVIGRRDAEAFPPGFGLVDPEEDRAMVDTPMVVDLPARQVLRADGKKRYLHAVTVPLFDAAGTIEHILCIAEDVTGRHQQEQKLRNAMAALREAGARLRTIADALPAMIAYVDAGEVLRFHNRAYQAELAGKGRTELLGLTLHEVLGEQRYRFVSPYLQRALQGEKTVFEEHDSGTGDEHAFESAQQVTYIPQWNDSGTAVIGCHIMRHDITMQQNEKKRLIMLARVDALTGLTNRAGFMLKLDNAMRHSTDAGMMMALMYMDIDHFKPVNDTHGHATGDALLQAFSARLVRAMRASDTVARLGGDEFTIIMENLTRRTDAMAAAAKIVQAMQAPFDLDGVTVSVSASIGVAFYNGGLLEPEELMRQADVMLYEAKQSGRNAFRAEA